MRRNFSDEPPTPDEPKDVWGNHNNNGATLYPRTTDVQRRRSFQKFLNDHPNIARKRSERLADGTYQTTIHLDRRERAPSPFHISYGASAAAAGAAAAKSAAAASNFHADGIATTSTPASEPFSVNASENRGTATARAQRLAFSQHDSAVSNQDDLSYPNIPRISHPQGSAPSSSSERANEQIFWSMDTNRDGLISWSEFLSYLNQSEARTGVYQHRSRRSSMGKGFNASTKLQRRLTLRKIFNKLDMSADGYVSLSELSRCLDEQPQLKAFLDLPSLQAMSMHRPSSYF